MHRTTLHDICGAECHVSAVLNKREHSLILSLVQIIDHCLFVLREINDTKLITLNCLYLSNFLKIIYFTYTLTCNLITCGICNVVV